MTQTNDSFLPRHIGPSQKDSLEMLKAIGSDSLETLVSETIPKSIISKKTLAIGKDVSEHDLAQFAVHFHQGFPKIHLRFTRRVGKRHERFL